MAFQNKSKLLKTAHKMPVNWPIYLSNLVTITTPSPIHTKGPTTISPPAYPLKDSALRSLLPYDKGPFVLV